MEQSKIVKIMIRVICYCGLYSGDTTIECDLQSGECIGKFLRYGCENWIPIQIPKCWSKAINEKKIFRLMKARSHRLTEEEFRMYPTDMSNYTIKIEYQGKVHEISGYRCEISHVPLFDEMIEVVSIGGDLMEQIEDVEQ